MVESSDVAIAGAALGGVYLLSARGRGGGDNQRPGRIPLPIPGGDSGGLSPGIAGLLASGGLGGGDGLSDIGDRLSGILGQQGSLFSDALGQQQTGISRLLDQQQKQQEQLLDAIDNLEVPEPTVNVDGGSNNRRSNGTSPSMSGTQQYRLEAADRGNIAPEARGANTFLEAARGFGEASGAALRTPSKGIDYAADLIGGDGPGAFSSSGGLSGAVAEVADAAPGGSGGGSSGSIDPSPGSVAAAPVTGGSSVVYEELTEDVVGAIR